MTAIDTVIRPYVHQTVDVKLPTAPLIVVVGFDGSQAARRALVQAAQLIEGREGRLEIVYVAHINAVARLSPDSMLGIRQALTDIFLGLRIEVDATLGEGELRWHLQRRDGFTGTELLARAGELRRQSGPNTPIVIVVGASEHKAHRRFGSVSAKLDRCSTFPLLVAES